MHRLRFIFGIALAAATLLAAGCSKKESETALPPTAEKPKPQQQQPPEPSETQSHATPSPAPAPQAVPAPPAVNSPSSQEESPAQLAAQVQQVESTYHNTPDFQKRIGLIYDLSSIESPATIDAIGRLMSNEADPELKVELINSLSDIDGENDKKLAILTGALRAEQPKDVRLEAIDAVAETEDKRGVQILQGLLQDPDEDIRDSTKDAIEQLQATVTNPQ